MGVAAEPQLFSRRVLLFAKWQTGQLTNWRIDLLTYRVKIKSFF